MKFYLAGAIDFAKDNGRGWRQQLKDSFATDKGDIIFFDPVPPYSFSQVTGELSQFVHDVNMFALNQCDAVVAVMMKDVQSVGTPIELYYAMEHHKPIVLVTNMLQSLYITYIAMKSTVIPVTSDVLDVDKIRNEIYTLKREHNERHG